MTEHRQNLARALSLAANCLAQVESGRSLSGALERVQGPERATTQALSLHAMRHWGLAKAWRSRAMARRSTHGPLNSLVALSLLLLDIAMLSEDAQTGPASHQSPLQPDAPRYPAHTVVDQSVRAARLLTNAAFAPRLVNAILRRFQRERAVFIESVADLDVARFGYPLWWQEQLQQTYPDTWQDILGVSRITPELVIRVNARHSSVQTVLQAMHDAGVDAQHLGEMAIVVRRAGGVERLPGFSDGWWSVQDWSAQKAAPLLAPFKGARVLDACAAPGGKSAHLLELAEISLTAVDQDARRLAMVEQNLQRLSLMDAARVRLVHADVRRSQAWREQEPFDLILADVPCTASGIVRRHPDIPWLRRESDLKQTTQLQQEILDALWPSLAASGRLLLATCSVFEQEGERQAQDFLSRHPDAVREPAPGQILPVAPGDGRISGYDGFFYALFGKRG